MAEVENPVKLTDEVRQKLEEAFEMDCTVEEAILHANISKQTFYNWTKSFPKLKERFDELKHRPFLKARQTIVKSLDNPQFAFEYMKRKKKNEFSERSELTGKDGEELGVIMYPQKHAKNILETESKTGNGDGQA